MGARLIRITSCHQCYHMGDWYGPHYECGKTQRKGPRRCPARGIPSWCELEEAPKEKEGT